MKKKIVLLVCVALLLAGLALTGCGSDGDALVLNVYNWGMNISDGSEGSLDTVKAFEKWYREEYGQKVTVHYSTYTSNEDMYSKLASGAVSYDVIIPSDYMIARMIEEGLLQPLNFDNIPNYKYIDDEVKGLYFDPENKYSVPYTYGVVGIMYDANVVDEADVGGWDLIWNEKYKDSILQFNNSRDAFGTAMYKLGLDVNSEDKAVWDRAYEELLKQRPLVYSLVMDEIFNILESGEAAIGTYYAGEYFLMVEDQAENVDLQFYYPEKTNYFVDSMCVPTCAQNKELAELFINFMLEEEPAIANAIYVSYACPNKLVYNNEEYIEEMGEEAVEILYMDIENFREKYNELAFRNLSPEILDYVNTLWENLRVH